MSNFDKAIKIIMAEPPELRYPAYFADLLRKADVPDTKVGNSSEIPNGSGKDIIYRQDAIDVVKRNTFRLVFTEEQNCEGHVAWSAEAVYSDVMEGALLELPSAQPETSLLTVKVAPDPEELERIARKIKDEPVTVLLSAEPETCEGCKHLGKWENEVEYGYPSPCTRCKRKVEDYYER